jgi:CheY-like chemotaxis protein
MADSQRKRILIVDDDADMRKTVTAMLESLDFIVTAVGGADAALALIENDRPDAILTDIHMAEGDGFELINAVRERGLTVPIVAMSGDRAPYSKRITWNMPGSCAPRPSWISPFELRISRK